jgi:hypothetical protein
MPPSPYYPQGIFVEDIEAPIQQHRYDMSATHAHIDAVNCTRQRHPTNDGFCFAPLIHSTQAHPFSSSLSERETVVRVGMDSSASWKGVFAHMIIS